MKPDRKFTLAVAIVALTIYCAKSARSDEAQAPPSIPPIPQDIVEPHVMEIIPAERLPQTNLLPISEIADPAAGSIVNTSEYRRVYDSIPFSRAEYKVNPNYRHDSTMEILTGNSRSQTIVHHNYEHKEPVKRTPAPSRPSRMLLPFSGMGYVWNSPLWFNRGY